MKLWGICDITDCRFNFLLCKLQNFQVILNKSFQSNEVYFWFHETSEFIQLIMFFIGLVLINSSWIKLNRSMLTLYGSTMWSYMSSVVHPLYWPFNQNRSFDFYWIFIFLYFKSYYEIFRFWNLQIAKFMIFLRIILTELLSIS